MGEHLDHSLDDLQLAQQAGADRSAFDALYRRYVTQVYRYCYVRVNDVAEAEDLTTQTFIAALESIASFRGNGAFAAWLFGIARRKCADFYRKAYAHPNTALDMAEQRADLGATDPEEAAFAGQVLDCVQRTLPTLSPDRAEAIHLRYWGNLDIKEVAAVMKRNQAAVKMLLSRALQDLRERCVR